MTDSSDSLNMMSALGQQPATFLGEVSVEPLAAVGIIETALTEVKDNLTEFAASGTFETDILTVFGESANVDLGETIINALAVGEDLPQIIVVPVEQMNGAAGAFDSVTGTVYLADSLIDGSSLPVAGVLTEELGHYIDSQLNPTDTPGDEGEHFAALVRGDVLSWEDVGRLRVEDDRVRIFGGLVEVEADDTFETAIDLGAITQDVVVNNDIGRGTGRRRDTRDYYRFELREESEVGATLDRLRGNADLRLYDNRKALFFESSNSGRRSETIETILDAGVYYLEISAVGPAKTPYKLSVSAEELMIDPDFTPELANDIGKLTQPYQTTDEIGAIFSRFFRDTQDWYRFELEEDSFVDVILSQLTGNADLSLYDSSRTPFFDSRESGNKPESVTEFLSAGVYYLQVSPAGSARTSYQLSLDASSVVSPIEGFDMGTLTPTRPTYSNVDTIGFAATFQNSIDRYSFTLPEESEVDLSLSQLRGDANLRLLDSSESIISISSNKGTNPEEIVESLTAGDYFLEVTPQGNVITPYQLTASLPGNQETATPEISIKNTRITEGNRGRKNAKFQITLDTKPEETVRVNYATANQTAKANQDYKRTKGILTFRPGQTRKTITVPILGDNKIEPNETFQLNLSKPRNAQLKDRRGIGTIRDNDFAQLSIKDSQITEGDNGKKQAKFTVALNQKINQRVQVNYATSDITAKEGSDYQQTQGKLTFKPNQKRKTITVPILGDTLDEDNEKFSVTLRKPSKGVRLGDKRAIGTIKDNDEGGDKPGDSFQAAINVGKLTEEWVTADRIGYSEAGDRETNDFYRFQTDREGTLLLILDDLRKDANLELYGSGEELINQSKNDDSSFEEIETRLDPGTYYVRVFPQGSDRTPYRLSIDLL
jgi:hypothetical protein